VASLAIVVGLAAATRYLTANVPAWFPSATWLKSVEFPLYAIAVGLIAGGTLRSFGLRDRLAIAFRTEFFIKAGLVLLGASINLAVIGRVAGPAIAQSIILISAVFLAAWWLGGLLKLDNRLRAVLAASVSICGVSAAIAAAGAVQAKSEQLAYITGLVILFALPSIFIQPWFAQTLGLREVVSGAWIGGNIDTTAAVTAAGAIVGDDALKVAAIVKQTQNAMMGVVAFLLTVYFVYRVERKPDERVPLAALWTRFPKFILGFLATSAIATLFIAASSNQASATQIVNVAGNDLRTWFFTFAFVCIGLEFRLGSLKEAGARPILVFSAATVFNLALALLLASILFAGVSVA
jgi:uncharacterized integral membrane protein (TIGR00698 family)